MAASMPPRGPAQTAGPLPRTDSARLPGERADDLPECVLAMLLGEERSRLRQRRQGALHAGRRGLAAADLDTGGLVVLALGQRGRVAAERDEPLAVGIAQPVLPHGVQRVQLLVQVVATVLASQEPVAGREGERVEG